MQCVGKVCGKLLLFYPNLADKRSRVSRLAGDASAPEGESKTGRLEHHRYRIPALMYIIVDAVVLRSLQNRRYLVLVCQILLFDFFFNHILLMIGINCRGGVATRWQCII